jgi:hypothetical protein
MVRPEEGRQAGDGLDDRARDGLDHLQAAAREMIQAARAMLDVAEHLVNDPATATTIVGALGAMAQAATANLMHPGPPAPSEESSSVEHITVRRATAGGNGDRARAAGSAET